MIASSSGGEMSWKRRLAIGVGIFVLLLVVLYVHLAVYPFNSAKPSFADVEKTFDRMQFPPEWEGIGSSENRGIAGRQCPIESESQCFHKSKTFKIPENTSTEDVQNIMLQTGCDTISVTDNTPLGEKEEPFNFECVVDGVEISGSLSG